MKKNKLALFFGFGAIAVTSLVACSVSPPVMQAAAQATQTNVEVDNGGYTFTYNNSLAEYIKYNTERISRNNYALDMTLTNGNLHISGITLSLAYVYTPTALNNPEFYVGFTDEHFDLDINIPFSVDKQYVWGAVHIVYDSGLAQQRKDLRFEILYTNRSTATVDINGFHETSETQYINPSTMVIAQGTGISTTSFQFYTVGFLLNAYNMYDTYTTLGQTSAQSYVEGYADGYNEGARQSDVANSIFDGILAVGTLPIQFFMTIFDFELFGINMSAILGALLTTCLIIIVVKLVTGGGGSKDNGEGK